MELPRNCRIVRQQPQRVRPDWGEISENKFHGGHGLVTLMERDDGFPQDEWLVLERPRGTDPLAVVDKMGRNHLWDVVRWDRPMTLLIRCGPLEYKDLWVDGAKPLVHIMYSEPRDLCRLLVAGFWSVVGPRLANMRLEGMFQAEKKEGEELLWGSWSEFVDPECEM